ncbi:hypothetical protein MKX03_022284 [Papaver bracteatum]|nr:hypothetical protein MKX03_022284 [Papaver bracteatum]
MGDNRALSLVHSWILEFQLYNSMTKEKEMVIPKEPGKVGIYVGGVPAYDLSCIRNAGAYAAVDVLDRYNTDMFFVSTLHLVYIIQNHYAYAADGDVYCPGDISWESSWGPGWHIECSAMSDRYLTSSFDIHGGGMDLIFPYHENELAQSCAARPNICEITNWMHNGFITKLYHPLVLRYLMMSTHYWDPVNYSQEQLEFASESVFYLYKTSLDCEKALFSFREKNPVIAKCKNIRLTLEAQRCIDKLMNDFYAKMSDDFRTPNILNAAAEQHELSLFPSLAEMEKEVKLVLDTLGLMSFLSYSEAKKDREFAKSDRIRLGSTVKGIFLVDLDGETQWRPCV